MEELALPDQPDPHCPSLEKITKEYESDGKISCEEGIWKRYLQRRRDISWQKP